MSNEEEIIELKKRLSEMESIVKELVLFKIYDDYNFKTDQYRIYYMNPTVFPLVEFENLVRRARKVTNNKGVL